MAILHIYWQRDADCNAHDYNIYDPVIDIKLMRARPNQIDSK